MKRRFPRAGGALLALAILLGVAAGIAARESSLGFLIGFGVGMVLLILVWMMDRR